MFSNVRRSKLFLLRYILQINSNSNLQTRKPRINCKIIRYHGYIVLSMPSSTTK